MATIPNHHYDQLNAIVRNLMMQKIIEELVVMPDMLSKIFPREPDIPLSFRKRVAGQINYFLWKVKTAWKVLLTGECDCGCDEW